MIHVSLGRWHPVELVIKVLVHKVLFFVVLLITGCGGGSTPSATNATPLTMVSGVAFAGAPFSSGTVSIYDFSTGAKGALLAIGSLSSNGAYEISVPSIPSVILIEAASGCYSEKAIPWGPTAYGVPTVSNAVVASVCVSTSSLSAAAPSAGTSSLVVAVTPFTHAAVGLAQYEVRNSSAVSISVNDANTRLSQWVGVDILKTIPSEPSRNSTFGDAALYGSILSGIPSWISNVPYYAQTGAVTPFGAGSLTTLAFADAMKSDFAQDGVLNGTGRDSNGNAVSVQVGSTALTATIYRHQLALYAVSRVRGETEGALGATSAESARIVSFLPALVAYNDSVSTLLDSSSLVPLDNGDPVISIGWPLPGYVLSGDQGPTGHIHDDVGIAPGNTLLLIDGVYYLWFNDSYNFNSFINTTVFSNGPHTIKIKATNNLGHIATASVNVTFHN